MTARSASPIFVFGGDSCPTHGQLRASALRTNSLAAQLDYSLCPLAPAATGTPLPVQLGSLLSIQHFLPVGANYGPGFGDSPGPFLRRADRKVAVNAYLPPMFKAFEFCRPTSATKVPFGPEWLHEIKYDGFHLRVERDGDHVRLITRGGYDWTKKYPWIVESALKNRHKRFVLDGEAVILGLDGISDFDALHSGKHNEEVQLCAFDVLAMDGDDLRELPLSMRKANLARLFARRPDGVFLSDFEQGEIGPELFRAACQMGLEGLVSKRRDRLYQSGKSKHWIKVKNRKHPAFERVKRIVCVGSRD
jgi:bifunctional non-homologous end joining protein LigD